MAPDPLDSRARDLALTAEDHSTEPTADLMAPGLAADGVTSAAAPSTPVPADKPTTTPGTPPSSEHAEAPVAAAETTSGAVSAAVTVTRTESTEAAPAALPAAAAPVSLVVPQLSLEERVRRLEDALAHLQEMRGMNRTPEPVSPTPVSAVPQAMSDRRGMVEAPRPVSYPAAPGPPATKSPRRRWPLFDAWAELRAIVRMFVDPRYSLPWSSRLLALILAAAFVTSHFWLPFTSFPIAGTLFDKSVDLVLGFALFKVLGHEARRYRETAPDLPPSLRL